MVDDEDVPEQAAAEAADDSADAKLTRALAVEPGTVIAGKYRVERLIAAGGMGAVLKAHHQVLDQVVAIKLMRPELAQHKEAGQRFLREARAAAKVESDFVARVTDVDLLENGTPFMVMEYLTGTDLSDVIDSGATMPVEQAVDFALQALSGLDAAHALGLVHRDLKPSNLFLVSRTDGSRRVKLLDFGISKVMDEGGTEALKAGAETATQAVLGTPRYMAPEQISSSKNCDERTDIWAIGLILYEMLTHQHPFTGDSAGAVLASVLTAEIKPARELREDIPTRLQMVIHQCMCREREGRFGSARALMRALAPHGSRRMQTLLLEPEELTGPVADTETYGTPMASMHPEELAKMRAGTFGMAEAETRLAVVGAKKAQPPSAETALAIDEALGNKGRSWVPIAAIVAVAVVAGGAWFALSGPAAETVPASTTEPSATEETIDSAIPPPPSEAPEPPPPPTASATASASASASAKVAVPVRRPVKGPLPSPTAKPTTTKSGGDDDILGGRD
jgi:serine/threonine protein kinase